jgi:hypothetical protein
MNLDIPFKEYTATNGRHLKHSSFSRGYAQYSHIRLFWSPGRLVRTGQEQVHTKSWAIRVFRSLSFGVRAARWSRNPVHFDASLRSFVPSIQPSAQCARAKASVTVQRFQLTLVSPL